MVEEEVSIRPKDKKGKILHTRKRKNKDDTKMDSISKLLSDVFHSNTTKIDIPTKKRIKKTPGRIKESMKNNAKALLKRKSESTVKSKSNSGIKREKTFTKSVIDEILSRQGVQQEPIKIKISLTEKEVKGKLQRKSKSIVKTKSNKSGKAVKPKITTLGKSVKDGDTPTQEIQKSPSTKKIRQKKMCDDEEESIKKNNQQVYSKAESVAKPKSKRSEKQENRPAFACVFCSCLFGNLDEFGKHDCKRNTQSRNVVDNSPKMQVSNAVNPKSGQNLNTAEALVHDISAMNDIKEEDNKDDLNKIIVVTGNQCNNNENAQDKDLNHNMKQETNEVHNIISIQAENESKMSCDGNIEDQSKKQVNEAINYTIDETRKSIRTKRSRKSLPRRVDSGVTEDIDKKPTRDTMKNMFAKRMVPISKENATPLKGPREQEDRDEMQVVIVSPNNSKVSKVPLKESGEETCFTFKRNPSPGDDGAHNKTLIESRGTNEFYTQETAKFCVDEDTADSDINQIDDMAGQTPQENIYLFKGTEQPNVKELQDKKQNYVTQSEIAPSFKGSQQEDIKDEHEEGPDIIGEKNSDISGHCSRKPDKGNRNRDKHNKTMNENSKQDSIGFNIDSTPRKYSDDDIITSSDKKQIIDTTRESAQAKTVQISRAGEDMVSKGTEPNNKEIPNKNQNDINEEDIEITYVGLARSRKGFASKGKQGQDMGDTEQRCLNQDNPTDVNEFDISSTQEEWSAQRSDDINISDAANQRIARAKESLLEIFKRVVLGENKNALKDTPSQEKEFDRSEGERLEDNSQQDSTISSGTAEPEDEQSPMNDSHISSSEIEVRKCLAQSTDDAAIYDSVNILTKASNMAQESVEPKLIQVSETDAASGNTSGDISDTSLDDFSALNGIRELDDKATPKKIANDNNTQETKTFNVSSIESKNEKDSSTIRKQQTLGDKKDLKSLNNNIEKKNTECDAVSPEGKARKILDVKEGNYSNHSTSDEEIKPSKGKRRKYVEQCSDDGEIVISSTRSSLRKRNKTLYVCKFCNSEFLSKPKIIEHECIDKIITKFYKVLHQCQKCCSKFGDENLLKNHVCPFGMNGIKRKTVAKSRRRSAAKSNSVIKSQMVDLKNNNKLRATRMTGSTKEKSDSMKSGKRPIKGKKRKRQATSQNIIRKGMYLDQTVPDTDVIITGSKGPNPKRAIKTFNTIFNTNLKRRFLNKKIRRCQLCGFSSPWSPSVIQHIMTAHLDTSQDATQGGMAREREDILDTREEDDVMVVDVKQKSSQHPGPVKQISGKNPAKQRLSSNLDSVKQTAGPNPDPVRQRSSLNTNPIKQRSGPDHARQISGPGPDPSNNLNKRSHPGQDRKNGEDDVEITCIKKKSRQDLVSGKQVGN